MPVPDKIDVQPARTASRNCRAITIRRHGGHPAMVSPRSLDSMDRTGTRTALLSLTAPGVPFDNPNGQSRSSAPSASAALIKWRRPTGWCSREACWFGPPTVRAPRTHEWRSTTAAPTAVVSGSTLPRLTAYPCRRVCSRTCSSSAFGASEPPGRGDGSRVAAGQGWRGGLRRFRLGAPCPHAGRCAVHAVTQSREEPRPPSAEHGDMHGLAQFLGQRDEIRLSAAYQLLLCPVPGGSEVENAGPAR